MYLDKIRLYLNVYRVLLLGLACFSVTAHGTSFPSHLEAKPGDIIQVTLSELHPTQMAVGKLQIIGKLAEYAEDTKALYNELCHVQGAGKVVDVRYSSIPQDPSSYTCQHAIGTYKADLNTVDVGPMGKLYLTDGHHGFNSFWDSAAGGGDVSLYVLVGQNISRDSEGTLLTNRQFEQKMKEIKHFLPIDAQGMPIIFSDLPESLGMRHFQNDPYRSMLYYLRGISYNKPEKIINPETGEYYAEVPFLEFYWGELLRSKMDLKQYNLNKQDDYIKALKEAALLMVTVPAHQVIGHSGKTAAALGQLKSVNEKRLSKLMASDSKLTKAFTYQTSHLH